EDRKECSSHLARPEAELELTARRRAWLLRTGRLRLAKSPEDEQRDDAPVAYEDRPESERRDERAAEDRPGEAPGTRRGVHVGERAGATVGRHAGDDPGDPGGPGRGAEESLRD